MKVILPPEVNMLLVSQSSRNQRKSILNFAPRIGLAVVDYGRLEEIDRFYLDCQNFRDYYRDPYKKLSRPVVFQKHYGKCGYRFQNKTTEMLMQPTSWIREKHPVLYPVNYGRDLVIDEGIRLGGQYNAASCIKYKH